MLAAAAERLAWPEALRAVADEPRFVRPDDDDELCTGAVFSADALHALHDRLPSVARERPVVVSPPRDIDAGARLFVVDRELVSGSFYRPTADPDLPCDPLQCATIALAAWLLHDVSTLDVAGS